MTYRTLPVEHTSGPAPLARLVHRQPRMLAEQAPAVSAMVDFAAEPALTTVPEQRVDAALEQMRAAGVHTLLVMVEKHVVGLITAADIQGEKPVQFVQSSDCLHPRCHHDDVEVGDVMTAIAALPLLHMEALEQASVGDVMETFRRTGRTHLLSLERTNEGTPRVRGLISRAQVERQLGLSPGEVALEQVEREISGFFLSGRLPA